MKINKSLNKTEQRLLDFVTTAISTHRQRPAFPLSDLVASFKVDNRLPTQCQDLGLVERVRGIGYVWRTDDPVKAFNAICELRKKEARQKRAPDQQTQTVFTEATTTADADADQQGPDLRTLETQIMAIHERISDLENTLLDAVVELTNQVIEIKK